MLPPVSGAQPRARSVPRDSPQLAPRTRRRSLEARRPSKARAAVMRPEEEGLPRYRSASRERWQADVSDATLNVPRRPSKEAPGGILRRPSKEQPEHFNLSRRASDGIPRRPLQDAADGPRLEAPAVDPPRAAAALDILRRPSTELAAALLRRPSTELLDGMPRRPSKEGAVLMRQSQQAFCQPPEPADVSAPELEADAEEALASLRATYSAALRCGGGAGTLAAARQGLVDLNRSLWPSQTPRRQSAEVDADMLIGESSSALPTPPDRALQLCESATLSARPPRREPAAKLRKHGWRAAELRELGYALAELAQAGFSLEELRAASGTSAAQTLADLKEAGFTLAELRAAGYTPAELTAAGHTAAQLKRAGCSLPDLVDAGHTLADLKRALYSAAELRAVAVGAARLREAGYTLRQLREASFPLAELQVPSSAHCNKETGGRRRSSSIARDLGGGDREDWLSLGGEGTHENVQVVSSTLWRFPCFG